jgi:hypothetical protein
MTAIKQGDIGDCFFMSMLGALVHMHPEKVCQMIEKDGKKYRVHFPGRPRPVQIGAPTDAEIALNTTARQNGLWLTVIEKAFAARTNRKLPMRKRERSPTDAIDGGYASDSVAALTGHGYISVGPRNPRLQAELQAAVAALPDLHGGAPGAGAAGTLAWPRLCRHRLRRQNAARGGLRPTRR